MGESRWTETISDDTCGMCDEGECWEAIISDRRYRGDSRETRPSMIVDLNTSVLIERNEFLLLYLRYVRSNLCVALFHQLCGFFQLKSTVIIRVRVCCDWDIFSYFVKQHPFNQLSRLPESDWQNKNDLKINAQRLLPKWMLCLVWNKLHHQIGMWFAPIKSHVTIHKKSFREGKWNHMFFCLMKSLD